jgi:hypothetical protein
MEWNERASLSLPGNRTLARGLNVILKFQDVHAKNDCRKVTVVSRKKTTSQPDSGSFVVISLLCRGLRRSGSGSGSGVCVVLMMSAGE